MFARLSRDYPAVSILLSAAGFALLYPVFRAISSGDDPLPFVSAMAFLFAGSVNAFMLISALYAERAVRNDPPLWRIRAVIAGGINFFLLTAVLTGVALPSGAALSLLSAGLVFAAIMVRFLRHEDMVVAPGLFDLERPLWATGMGDAVATYSGFAMMGWVVLIALFAPSTAFGLFAVILLMPWMLPLNLKAGKRWLERDWLPLSAVAGVMVGLFTAD
jgi:hypothetical protein